MHVEMPTSNTVHTTILIQFSVYTRESNWNAKKLL
jgi:hypothetical protein